MKLCECGCGKPAPIAAKSWAKWGWVKGEPKRFVHGHSFRGRTHGGAARVAIATGGLKRRGAANPRWAQGRTKRRDGYIVLNFEHGRVLEHRQVMADHLGRPLDPIEVVHHKLECEGGTGRVDDNRIENLLLFDNHAAHKRHHDKLRRKFGRSGYARQIYENA